MEDLHKASSAEWDVMRVIWSLDDATSRSVADILKASKNWEMATTKTLLGRLVKKGYLETEKDGNRFIYRAKVTEEESVSKRVDRLFSSICESAVGNAIATAITDYDLSNDDRDLILKALEGKTFVESIACNCVPHDGKPCTCEPGNCTCGK
ncbi:CopY/TcrY family copper transport repressor [Erysipelothrix sp. HDW6C]|uniref:CopY/TcrY family copper transport repressor n=1 Tax=Erysipelothrix sp. HDW6C TaxID=2714930 RepID=UPI00140B8824|nr:CopY/TcrY family copper transport repressor [Erysipelothrix sp. HDW6C]QIK70755.1 CopY/TcrY family copper transport repressor [Erysipelothrix sp. HDW6C]